MVQKLIETLKKNISQYIINLELINENELYVEINAENIKEACCFLYAEIDSRLISLFANDESLISEGYSLFYTFAINSINTLVIFRIRLKDENEEIKSIALEIPAAFLYEREIKDMFGLKFIGLPDEREFVFHGNWPAELHPLRKSFKKDYKPPFLDRKQEFTKINGTGVFEVPVGPVHAGIIEPGHFRFSVAGEPIINLEAKLYYVQKGIEKLSENQDFNKVLFLSERISGDETFSNSLAYCLAIEKIAGLNEVPLRASYQRVILSELERIYNHLGDISGVAVDVAFGFASSQFAMMRRWMQMLNEELTGSRFLRSTNRPGGLRKDFVKGKENKLLETINKLDKEFNDSVNILRSSSLYIDRVENAGVLKHETAVDLNAVGPAGRSSGIDSDVRRDFPYAAYAKLKFDVHIHNNGDVNCRVNTKIDEVNEAIKLIRAAMDVMPEGSMLEEIKELKPYTFAFGLTEANRGENCHFVMTGENNTIYRYKVRTPSFCNWPNLCLAVKGNIIPDFPLINKSFNLSYSGNDL